MKKFHTTGATPFPRTPHPPSGSTLSNATTPLKHKIKSYTALNTPRLIKDNMDPMLKNELGTSQLKDVPDLVPVLFPDACLPLPPSDIFKALSTGPSALHDGKAWVGCPNLARASFKGDVERELVDFLHVLRDRIMKICEEAGKPLPQEKGWTAKFADHGVEAAPNVRKPDLLFGGEEWPDVDVHGELKSNDDSHTRGKALEQLLNGAYLMFSSQDDRRFVVSIAFMAYNIRLHVFDRAGLVATAPFHLHKEPEMFVRVLVGLMLNNDPAVLGYDTSITKTGDHRFIEVDGIQYQIIKTLFISDVVRGRGTVCWHARHGGKDFVIKDTWADDSRTHIEAEILRMAEDVEGVPKVVADVIVKVNGVEGNTHTLRSNISKLDDSIETRVHRRLVLTPFGNPLCTFATQKELISIFIDAITAHRDLYEKTKILHRDISLNNILLVPSSQPSDRADFPPTPLSLVATSSTTQAPCPAKPASSDPPAPSPRRGLLIDMDYALVLNSEGERGPVAVGHRTGTLPFMAVDVLCASGVLVAHEPCHDLESFLYVLIWICVHYAGPGDVERQNFDVRNSPMSGWVVGNEYLNIGNAKDSALRHPKHWVPQVLNCFAPYFEPLKPCASAWRQLYVDSNLTYDAVLDVLRTTFASLEDVESWSKESDPEGYGDGKKRKRLARITEEGQEPDANDARAQKAGRSGIDHVHVHSDPTGYREKLRQRRPPGKSSLQQS